MVETKEGNFGKNQSKLVVSICVKSLRILLGLKWGQKVVVVESISLFQDAVLKIPGKLTILLPERYRLGYGCYGSPRTRKEWPLNSPRVCELAICHH